KPPKSYPTFFSRPRQDMTLGDSKGHARRPTPGPPHILEDMNPCHLVHATRPPSRGADFQSARTPAGPDDKSGPRSKAGIKWKRHLTKGPRLGTVAHAVAGDLGHRQPSRLLRHDPVRVVDEAGRHVGGGLVPARVFPADFRLAVLPAVRLSARPPAAQAEAAAPTPLSQDQPAGAARGGGRPAGGRRAGRVVG